jgi:hypothetical protein
MRINVWTHRDADIGPKTFTLTFFNFTRVIQSISIVSVHLCAPLCTGPTSCWDMNDAWQESQTHDLVPCSPVPYYDNWPSLWSRIKCYLDAADEFSKCNFSPFLKFISSKVFPLCSVSSWVIQVSSTVE